MHVIAIALFVALVSNKEIRSGYSNHHGISSVPIIAKVFNFGDPTRSDTDSQDQRPEQQTGFHLSRGCTDQIFILRQLLVMYHTHRRPTVANFGFERHLRFSRPSFSMRKVCVHQKQSMVETNLNAVVVIVAPISRNNNWISNVRFCLGDY